MAKKKRTRKNNELEGGKTAFSFRKHILPPLSGIAFFLLILLLFNAQFFAGLFYSPELNAQADSFNVRLEKKPVDPNAPSRIIINSVNVEAPINFEQTSINESDFQIALRDGVVHYPNTARPGEVGNVVIFGHSSGVWWAKGNYKFVFAPLHEIVKQHRIYVEFQGTRYIYEVTGTRVVEPENVSVLSQGNEKTLTLITCTPIGTNQKRLIVDAKQIAPNYTVDEASSEPQQQINQIEDLPGSTPSFWSTLFDIF